MKYLFTSDWQLEYANIETCRLVVDEMLELSKKHKVDTLVHCGDFKDTYNPIDTRVLNFAISVVSRFRKADLEVLLLLGNHDRIGLHEDRDNWFPALRHAGAQTFTTPKKSGDLCMLPYCNDPEKLQEAVKVFARSPNSGRSILVFHETLIGARYNQLKKADEGRLGPGDLMPNYFLHCVGGDVHLPQSLSPNITYVGSPFPVDWGEANQKKGYLLYDSDTRLLKRLYTKLPGYYDPSWPRFEETKPESWAGTSVRVHVLLDKSARDGAALLTAAKTRAEHEYKGARIVTVPEYVTTGAAADITYTSSDLSNITEYVTQSLPATLTDRADQMTAYLHDRLRRVSPLAVNKTGVRFLRTRAENFLGYETLDVDYQKRGLTVIKGFDKNWPGVSNGAGKSSYLQGPVVALFGETVKGQRAGNWVRRNSKGKAFVEFTFELSDGRKCVITRQRRPTKYAIEIDGVDKSTGNRPEMLLEFAERLTGLTKIGLSNTVYIDQKKTSSLISGTDKERKDILEGFQNLQRYAEALDLIKKDGVSADRLLSKFHDQEEALTAEFDNWNAFLNALATDELTHLEARHKLVTAGHAELMANLKQQEVALSQKWTALEEVVKGYKKQVADLTYEHMQLRSNKEQASGELIRLTELDAECPVCKQRVDKSTVRLTAELRKKMANDDAAAEILVVKIRKLRNKIQQCVADLDEITETIKVGAAAPAELQQEIAELNGKLEQARKAAVTKDKVTQRMRRCHQKLQATVRAVKATERELEFYDYAIKAFSRSGLPAFLNALMCPRLNSAAKYYSELFADSRIGAEFAIKDGEFDVGILNPFGGETIKDQSPGEEKMASLIGTFALIDATSPANILVCDEPGENLDPYNAKMFARGLKKISKRFDSVFLITHNSAIMQELSAEPFVEIVKENGVSRVNMEVNR